MRYHVFAVWDFMSLLKALQRGICGVDVPWLPAADCATTRMINEIVLGEESDEVDAGGYASHYDLYHRAMRQSGAETDVVDGFLNDLRAGARVDAALADSAAPESVKQFVAQTFDLIDGGQLCAIASSFTFGREDLLPDVFQRIVDQLNDRAGGELDLFLYYLNRHIELDGDRHGPMAARLIASLCGEDDANWRIAEDAAVSALESRLVMWDGMVESMRHASM